MIKLHCTLCGWTGPEGHIHHCMYDKPITEESLRKSIESLRQYAVKPEQIGRVFNYTIIDDPIVPTVQDNFNRFCELRDYYAKVFEELTTMPTTTNYIPLSEQWTSRGKVTAIKDLATPHLKNIIDLWEKNPQKYYEHYRDLDEQKILHRRIANVRLEYERRTNNNLNQRIRDCRIRLENIRNSTLYWPRPQEDNFRAIHELLLELENKNV